MKCEKRRVAYKNYVFRMMKDIVKKNTCNYINLLTSINVRDIPERDELITDCYIMFDKCITKYKVCSGNNFYFYYNKSMSRNFFRNYQRKLNTNSVELTDAMTVAHPNLHCHKQPDTTEILMDGLQFDEIEKRIIRSRMNGQKTAEFLAENTDVNNGQYSRKLKRIKNILIYQKEIGGL